MPDPATLPRRPPPRGLKALGVTLLIVAVAVAVGGVVMRVRADQTLRSWTHEQAIPTVALAKVAGAGAQTLTLPGAIQAFTSAPIYARTSGYLRRWYVDIGAPVRAGQLLAEIDTPDLDQQVAQARADLATAQANETLSRTTAARWAALLQRDIVSRQAAEEKAGDLAARTSAVNSARANLDRLRALEGFKRIVAPFDGMVTTRSTDVGALVSAGGGSQEPLFTVADQRRLRIYVKVPQSYSAQVRPGMTADVTVPEYPGETFTATLVNASPSISSESGAMLVELQLANPGARLKPGSYAEVSLRLPLVAGRASVPATALVSGHDGPTLVVLGADNRIALQRVTIGADLGAVVEISSGLKAGARVIDNPPESLRPGDLVHVVAGPPGRGS